MRSFRQALPNLRRVFATKQAGGLIALIGWADRPLASSVDEAKKMVLANFERLRSAGQANYKVVTDQPWAIIDLRDHLNEKDNGKPRRDVGMAVVADRNCLFSVKFSGTKQAGDDGVWAALDNEFQRIRRVIGNYEGGKPWVLSGAK